MNNQILISWLQERLNNCKEIAETKTGEDRAGWIEDAGFFEWAITKIKNTEKRQITVDDIVGWSNFIAGKLGSDRASELSPEEIGLAQAIAEAVRDD